MQPSFEKRYVEVNEVRLHVVEAGPRDGRLVIFLHGFPEFWYGWRRQIEPFAAAGYRVLVPDQRGYNLSGKPPSVRHYGLDTLVADVVGLVREAGRDSTLLVGHDWGGAVAWWTAVRHPDLVQRLAVLNMPHPLVMRRFLKSDRAQRRKSRYIFLFQLPWLPEMRLRRRDWQSAVRALQRTSRPGTFSDEDMEAYREAWRRPGAARAMIHWYRAAMRRPPRRVPDPRVRVPTLIVWGARDRFLGREMVEPSLELCEQGRAEVIEEATHWIQHEEPARVNRLLLEFFL